MQASKGQDYESFKQSISKLKAVARDPSTQKILTPLDVFRVLEGSGMVYAMTLMAFCGVHGQKEMVQLLLNEGASKLMYTIGQKDNSLELHESTHIYMPTYYLMAILL